jgi:hypothetical protein
MNGLLYQMLQCNPLSSLSIKYIHTTQVSKAQIAHETLPFVIKQSPFDNVA